MKRRTEVREEDFARSPEEQPIVLESHLSTSIATSGTVLGAGLGGLAGAGIGCAGLVAGPLAIITIPGGLLLGILIGGVIGIGTVYGGKTINDTLTSKQNKR